jgi:hypothetical protein
MYFRLACQETYENCRQEGLLLICDVVSIRRRASYSLHLIMIVD